MPDEPRFMPSEVLVVRPHDAPWERLARGWRVAIAPSGWPGAEMRVTDVIVHVDGDETYVLEDVAVTDEQVAERQREQAAMFASIAACGNCCPPDDAGPHPGGIVQGAAGGDSVLAMLHPGERWYSADEVRRMTSGETGL